MKGVFLMSKLKIFLALFIVFICCSAALSAGNEWNCPECGSINSGNFCTQCGTKKPEEIICPNCGEKYSLDSGVNFCGKCGTKLRQGQVQRKGTYEGSGFDTPEDAVRCYLEGLKNLDFEKMLSAFAWETQAKNYSTENASKRIKAYVPSSPARMPSVNDFMLSANVHSIRNREINYIYYAIEAYCLDYPKDWDTLIHLKTEEEVDAFLKKFSKEKISQISNIQFISPELVAGKNFSSESNQISLDRERIRYGADELVNVPAVAEVGSNQVLFCCPTVVRYGEKWYIASVGSNVNGFLKITIYCQAFTCRNGSLKDIIK